MAEIVSVSEHRRRLKVLMLEYQAFMFRLKEFDGPTTGVMVDAFVLAMTTHMRALKFPESTIARLLSARQRAAADFLEVRSSVEKTLRRFDAIASADPVLANRLVVEFAQIGRFIQAERATPFAMPERMQ